MENQLTKQSLANMSLDKACPICLTGNVSSFLEILEVPVHTGLLWSSKDSAKQCPKANINLGFCDSCGFITNISFDPSRLEYTEGYDNSLNFSSIFQNYARSLALQLIERYDLFNKDIIEIGCGDGNFLRLLCELGGNRGIGFDPSYKKTCNENNDLKDITFIKDLYSAKYDNVKADFICCRHVLEHLYNPIEFLNMVHNTIKGKLQPALYFEVPNVSYILRNYSFWDVIYEHCSYFSHYSLRNAFLSSKFFIRDLYEAFDKECLGIEALSIEGGTQTQLKHEEDTSTLALKINNFAKNYNKKLNFWQEHLECLKGTGQRAVVWGAGARGISFVNMLKLQDHLEYLVDINPHKHGMYVPGTAQLIVSPEFLCEYRPEIIIIMNQIYKNEIHQIVYDLGLKPMFFYA